MEVDGLGKYAGMEWVGINAIKKAGSNMQRWRWMVLVNMQG